jgi:hypothetical protein
MEFYNELQALQDVEDSGYEPAWSSYKGNQFIVFAKKKDE